MTENSKPNRSFPWLLNLLLIFVLLAGAYFRFSGLEWDEFTWMHPDERFLVWVTADTKPVAGIGEFFDTATSTLNPHNVGHTFFVYGTFPIFLTRYLTSALFENAGWQEIATVGRTLSAMFDLLSVLLVYLIAARIFNRKVALLSAAFLSAAVLPIQLSHFYKEDTFLNFFTLLAIYFAVVIATRGRRKESQADETESEQDQRLQLNFRTEWLTFMGFGIALGLAVASKINAAPVAFLLPVAVFIRYYDLSPEGKNRNLYQILLVLAFAAGISLLTFRIFQPYAFSGPGFFGLKPNPEWIADIREQRNQAAGDIDFPPSLQWARRPIWFGWQNLVLWGLGLPLGLLAWFGFLWAGWRMLRGEWRVHLVLWSWTAGYFIWQSVQFNPTMRYFLPIYPTLVIYAGWALVALWDVWTVRQSTGRGRVPDKLAGFARLMAPFLGLIILISTFLYAYGFSRIQTQPFTRAEASRWIYDNIPGPINLPVSSTEGVTNQIISVPYDYLLTPEVPFKTTLQIRESGVLTEVLLHDVADRYLSQGAPKLLLRIQQGGGILEPLALGSGTAEYFLDGDTQMRLDFELDREVPLFTDQVYYVVLEPTPGQLPLISDGSLLVRYESGGEFMEQQIPVAGQVMESALPVEFIFQPETAGILDSISLSGSLQPLEGPAAQSLAVEISAMPDGGELLASGEVELGDGTASPQRIPLDSEVVVQEDETIYLTLRLQGENGSGVNLRGGAVANEGDWDDGLPLRMAGYDPFGGIYQRDLNLNMYLDDNPEKLARFERILDQAEYLVISSSRQWGTLPRLPERFPMTTTYYRNLLGCPVEHTIERCYNIAEPGMFRGNLGFDLVEVFQSQPQVGSLVVNDQFAEEAFTVYDHPKVFVFKKSSQYDSGRVSEILGEADFAHIIRVTPKRAESRPLDLMLPELRFQIQQVYGTWRELFNLDRLINQSQIFAGMVWYLFIFGLGVVVYPILRRSLPGLADRGYPAARLLGMLLFAYTAWLLGSFNLPVTRGVLFGIFLLLLILGAGLAFFQRSELRQELVARRNYFLLIELAALLAFLVFLFIRWGNPDLWHPWKGGEKPMDFAYLNAVLKSATFPPYDPWYAGGYINYYYFGFVLTGMPVKLLGIAPSVAYNLILPTLFTLVLLAAFSLGYNLINAPGQRAPDLPQKGKFWAGLRSDFLTDRGYWVGALAALLVGVVGNLGTLRMILRGYQMIAAPGSIENAGILNRLVWGVQGFFRSLTGAEMPYGVADWYWIPSRVIPALGDVEPITEFPYFTVLYADLHAHLIALPLTLFVLLWGLNAVQCRSNWGKWVWTLTSLLIGGLAIGALRPTNTWDLPTYLLLGSLAVFYAALRSDPEKVARLWSFLPSRSIRLVRGLGLVALLVGFTLVLYQPYAYWYAQGYNSIDFWQGSHTPLYDYLTHWGFFIFVIFSWLLVETIDWMASTPLSALRKLEPYKFWIWTAISVLILVTLLLAVRIPGFDGPPFGRSIPVAWLSLPMAAWAGVLLLRPHQQDEKRMILFLIGSGFFLTLVVEIIVLVGDIGRMNTVFKFYYQVWIMFALSSAAGLGWLLSRAADWQPALRYVWRAGFAFLMIAAAMYPLLATTAKIKDRMAPQAPRSLDGMVYMPYGTYFDQGMELRLGEDYEAIRWLQRNLEGSPVIMEGNTPEYRWGSRISINTGLPSVVGWNWHQRQQRGSVVPSDWITNRIGTVSAFYTSPDPELAYEYLKKYAVEYFIVGQLEQAYYPGVGLDKFATNRGVFWELVFENETTQIYRVLPQAEQTVSN